MVRNLPDAFDCGRRRRRGFDLNQKGAPGRLESESSERLELVDVARAEEGHVLARLYAHRGVVGISERHAVVAPGPFLEPGDDAQQIQAHVALAVERVL